MLGWGTMCFMPFIHNLQSMYLATHNVHIPLGAALIIAALGLTCIYINYDADEMRLRVRRAHPKILTIWGSPAEIILAKYRTSDGQERTSVLLASGYNGVSRHFHYLRMHLPPLLLSLSVVAVASSADSVSQNGRWC